VNARINAGLRVDINEMPLDEARAAGAVMLMGEKGERYGARVRVVSVGESVELCGGTHIGNTAQIRVFKLVSETGVAAGVRRIEAVTGGAAWERYRASEALLNEAAQTLKTTPDLLPQRVAALAAELKQAKQEIEKLQSRLAEGGAADVLQRAETVGGLRFLAARFDGMDANALRGMGDKLKERVDALLLCGVTDAVVFIANVSDAAAGKGVHAGDMVKTAAALCGGGGGGKQRSAQAGGRDVSKADEALAAGIEQAKRGLL
jgi:alanyl-tRNA synthetase